VVFPSFRVAGCTGLAGMNKQGRTPEILAPAGSMEALWAGLNSGADAVYLGGKEFSARQYAANFDLEEIKEAIRYAHGRAARLYVTVNTLLDNQELTRAVDYLYFLLQTGVDAVIIQDLGLLRLATMVLPELEVHASTQMTTHNTEGVLFLKAAGVKRVVLARELSLADIRHIGEQSGMELEVFVHGALCLAYSGQCLMSSMIGGRSGNRGRCAQPCRLPYTLTDREGKPVGDLVDCHLLSTRDLNTLALLPDLVQAGISSFKFEGRMKRPEYVATVIGIYRQALDRLMAEPEGWRDLPAEQRDLAQIFNRDFTTGYFLANQGIEMMSYGRPNNRGLYLGRVIRTNRSYQTATIKLEQDLHTGDGIEVWVTKGGRQGTTINQIFRDGRLVEKVSAGDEVEVSLPKGVRLGDRVFKTSDVRLLERAKLAAKPLPEIKVPVTVRVEAKVGQTLKVEYRDQDGHWGVGNTRVVAEAAKKHPLNEEVLWAQLGRLGDTPFILDRLFMDIQPGLMVPLSELNHARREAVEDLLRQRHPQGQYPSPAEYRQRLTKALDQEAFMHRGGRRRQPRLAVAVGDPAGVEAAIVSGADRVYFGGEQLARRPFPRIQVELAFQRCRDAGVEGWLLTPRIWHPRERSSVLSQLETGFSAGANGVMVANLGTLELVLREFPQARVWADYPLNLYNDQAILFLSDRGVYGFCLSPELNLGQIRQMQCTKRFEVECVIHGQIPLMVSEHCTIGAALGGRAPSNPCRKVCRQGRYGLLDRKGYIFPVEVDRQCRMYIFNSKELCLAENITDIMQAGVSMVRVEARTREDHYIRRVTAAYRAILEAPDEMKARIGAAQMQSLAELSPQGFTKGHYFRGVL